MTATISARAAHVLEGAFLARATYGAEYIDSAFWVGGDNDAEKADDYRGYAASQGFRLLDASDLPTFDGKGGDAYFTANGLYDARVDTLTTHSFDAQGLLAVHGHTLVLAFRGTDGEDPAVLSGQAFTGQGIAANYKAFRPLIDAAYDYLKTHPEITDVVVSGHSLGGAMADVFTLVDADRFRLLRPDHLTVVSLGSSGVPPDLPNYLGGIDSAAATVVKHTIEIFPGVDLVTKEITAINLPGDYVSVANSQDRPHFADKFPDVPEDVGLVPIATLKDNLQIGGDTVFYLPNIINSDVAYYNPLTDPDHIADFRGMGAEHSSALLWANLQGLLTDELFSFYDGQKLIAGITDYHKVPDFNGDPLALFVGYLWRDVPGIEDDRGDRRLIGFTGNDYMLGLAGDDRIEGRDGNDLLSGGAGHDELLGGRGNDRLSGGNESDVLTGGRGADRFVYTEIADSTRDRGDVITDFTPGLDRIDFKAIDADPGKSGDQALSFIGQEAFSGLGQIRAVAVAGGTELRLNLTGTPGAEMAILLENVRADTLHASDFIL